MREHNVSRRVLRQLYRPLRFECQPITGRRTFRNLLDAHIRQFLVYVHDQARLDDLHLAPPSAQSPFGSSKGPTRKGGVPFPVGESEFLERLLHLGRDLDGMLRLKYFLQLVVPP